MNSTRDGIEVRWHPDMGETEEFPDEVVATDVFVHAERMDANHMWIEIRNAEDTGSVHMNLWAERDPNNRRKLIVKMRVERNV